MINFARIFSLPLRSRSRTYLTRATSENVNGFAGICCSRINQKRLISSTTSSDEGSVSKLTEPSETASAGQQVNEVQKGGFIRAMAKMEGHESFAKMLRNSPLVQMGDPHGKIVEGTIVHVVDDDLYIDFGAKFNCVCPRPQKNGPSYTLGKKVRIVVHDLELSTRFLGAKTDLTILEADCSLIGLLGKQDRLTSFEDSAVNKPI